MFYYFAVILAIHIFKGKNTLAIQRQKSNKTMLPAR